MELVKNIFFNTDKIVEGATVKISYVGTLFQDGAKDVYLHFGFGPNWDGVSEIKMEKTELGFQGEITIPEGSETLNLCYKDENENWDNNEGTNYIFTVETTTPTVDEIDETAEAEETALTLTEETGMQAHKGLRKTYMWSKKIRLAIYKLIKYVPKIISGNYKRKIDEQ